MDAVTRLRLESLLAVLPGGLVCRHVYSAVRTEDTSLTSREQNWRSDTHGRRERHDALQRGFLGSHSGCELP